MKRFYLVVAFVSVFIIGVLIGQAGWFGQKQKANERDLDIYFRDTITIRTGGDDPLVIRPFRVLRKDEGEVIGIVPPPGRITTISFNQGETVVAGTEVKEPK